MKKEITDDSVEPLVLTSFSMALLNTHTHINTKNILI